MRIVQRNLRIRGREDESILNALLTDSESCISSLGARTCNATPLSHENLTLLHDFWHNAHEKQMTRIMDG